MKNVVIVSQRVDEVKGYGERRDALDQRMTLLLRETGVFPFPAPNIPGVVQEMLSAVAPVGILLSGGNSPVAYGGDAPERDAVDNLLLDYAVQKRVPLAGVCRGMQSIVLYFGGTLQSCIGHTAVLHQLSGIIRREVNSYHSLAPQQVPMDMEVLARSKDSGVEAVHHRNFRIVGIMWHPERIENTQGFAKADVNFLKQMWVGDT